VNLIPSSRCRRRIGVGSLFHLCGNSRLLLTNNWLTQLPAVTRLMLRNSIALSCQRQRCELGIRGPLLPFIMITRYLSWKLMILNHVPEVPWSSFYLAVGKIGWWDGLHHIVTAVSEQIAMTRTMLDHRDWRAKAEAIGRFTWNLKGWSPTYWTDNLHVMLVISPTVVSGQVRGYLSSFRLIRASPPLLVSYKFRLLGE